jgi:hypothetical protein
MNDDVGVVNVEKDMLTNSPSVTSHTLEDSGIVGAEYDGVDVIDTALSICTELHAAYGSPELLVEVPHIVNQEVWGVIDAMFPDSMVVKFYRDEGVVVEEYLKELKKSGVVVTEQVIDRTRAHVRSVYGIMDGIDRGFDVDVKDMKTYPCLWINVLLDYLGIDHRSFDEWDQAVEYIQFLKHLDCPMET